MICLTCHLALALKAVGFSQRILAVGLAASDNTPEDDRKHSCDPMWTSSNGGLVHQSC